MLHLLSDWEYPHWMMMAGAILAALGFIGFCISSKQERAGQRVGPGTGIHHPNRTAKGYAGIRIRIGCRPAEGEGEARAYMIGLPLKWFKLKAKGK